jgi:hypothetical protein
MRYGDANAAVTHVLLAAAHCVLEVGQLYPEQPVTETPAVEYVLFALAYADG